MTTVNTDLTVIILTFNEEKHIRRCLESVKDIAERIVVIDCYSTDKTKEIALEFGADVKENKWVNYATQFNWGLENANITSQWVMRLDADEIVTHELAESILSRLGSFSEAIHGLTIKRRIYFLGQWIKYGGIYPVKMLRIFRRGHGYCENRWMDEHIIVKGDISHLKGDVADINLNNLTWWTDKHNHYATREAIDLLLMERGVDKSERDTMAMSKQAKLKRWGKEKIYSKLPLGVRSTFYFVARYFLLLGFLDGSKGFAFHFLQGYWYRVLVDYKVSEIRELMRSRGQSLEEIVRAEYGHNINS